ncbi:MAG: hypothetical protein ACYDAR_18860 [Thermomicrobiales bacterium]
MADSEIIAEIRAAIEIANYELDLAKCSRHMGNEGFTIFEAEHAVLYGDVIAAERGRWLFCGDVATLRQDARFHGRWLHVSAEYDVETGVVLITMYRPDLREWRTERIRR